MTEVFKNEVDKGLQEDNKTLPSKYFYDKIGDALFVEIMNLPEYYLTRCELDIFQNKTQELIESFSVSTDSYFELIELGAGDGTKTKELLRSLGAQNYNFDYFPIDISSNALSLLEKDLKSELPNLSVQIQEGDYFKVLASLKESKKPKIVLFLGSNIGNMSDDMAAEFIYNLGSNLQAGDKLLLGVDLIKARHVVLPAYNDSRGITEKFNLNLLDRINNELGGNFNLNQFKHQPEYDEREGVAKSFIVSTVNQSVEINATGKTYNFTEGEKIHTEISRKYNDALIEKIIEKTDFNLETKILDSKAYFADYILRRD
ncbi:L-histidine N(alpha)-methyltransferase [Algibacter amylolyticus]|uniref:L-histidine N(Alpha)-methyltransferase n=1 Tax=Algibacter amylolyticus TaxID=1608400 RepID=A0A5M7BHY3_9FLAO|nr:L-histidine N(alpha)-methyltransferase [Algibacter amylolyticus]KAA5827928.1 L-histidine N(alpha)-methyltransferase [Algibacter amylolyticus]MBB5267162.1 dimethylhistidine N-methyltransferase [Algibacter amylolyticus]TSJ82173.1 L-histidine N(alpha)-methyltransferase [Algibacter amylolyticus]